MTYTNDPILPPWYVPGFSVQLASYPVNIPGNDVGDPFPPNLSVRKVVGNFFGTDTSERTGYITFKPSVKSIAYVSDGVNVTITASSQKRYLKKGALTVDLLATNNLNTLPGQFTYEVKEHWLNGRTYDITVPRSDEDYPDDLDINDLIVPAPTENEDDISIYAGDSYDFSVQYLSDTELDLTGYTGTLTFRSYGTDVLVKTCDVELEDSSFSIHVSPEETQALQDGRATDYRFRITSSDEDDVQTLVVGLVVIT